jgi:hypothetical protein
MQYSSFNDQSVINDAYGNEQRRALEKVLSLPFTHRSFAVVAHCYQSLCPVAAWSIGASFKVNSFMVDAACC